MASRPSCQSKSDYFAKQRDVSLLTGVPPLTVLRQTLHLFITNLKVRKRYPVYAVAEALFPVMVVGIFCLLFYVMGGPDSDGNLYSQHSPPPTGCLPSDGILKESYATGMQQGELWFAIDTRADDSDATWKTARKTLTEVVSRMLAAENYQGKQRWFDESEDMEKILCSATNNTILPFAAITFSRALSLHKSCVTLGRRMTLSGWNATMPTYDGLHYVIHQSDLPSGDLTFSSVKPYVAAPTRKYTKKLLALQAALDRAIFSLAIGSESINATMYEMQNTYVRRYPPPSQDIQMRIGNLSLAENSESLRWMVARDQIFRRGGGPVVALSWLMTFSVAATSSVRAREAGSTPCLHVLGLSPVAQGAATVGAACFVSTIPIIFQVLILVQSKALINVDVAVMFVYIFCFVFSVVAAAQLVAVFFTNPSYTPVFCVVIYSITIITGISLAECNETHYGQAEGCIVSNRKLGGSLLSPVALILGFSEIVIRINDEGGKVTWSNLSTGKAAVGLGTIDKDDDFSISTTLGMMVGDAFLYLLLTWYISRVTQNGYKWYFPFQRTYWCSSPLTERPPAIPSQPAYEAGPKDPSKNVLSVRGLTASVPIARKFGIGLNICNDRKRVLDEVSLDLYPGQVFAILGSEGKSSLIRCLTGQMIPDAGQVYLAGRVIQPALFQYRMKMGLAPEKDYLYECLTVYEHLVLASIIKGIPRLQVKAQAESMAAEVELLTQRNQRIGNLTPGQKKKLQVAMAFLGDSRLVFLDEPTTDMDPVSIQKLRDLIRRLKKNRIVVLVTSSMEEAEFVADRITIMQKGRPRCVGSSGFLKKTFGCGYLVTIGKSTRLKTHRDGYSESGSDSPEPEQEQLVHSVSRLAPSSFLRESKVEIKVHVPLQNVDELTYLLRGLETKGSSLHGRVKTWSLKTNSLEDIFLSLLEEGEEIIACPSGHVFRAIESKTPCAGSGPNEKCDGNATRGSEALYCDICKTTMCRACASRHTNDQTNRLQTPVPMTMSPLTMAPQASPFGECVTPRVEGQPAKLNSFWQDTNLQEFIDNADVCFEPDASPRTPNRSFSPIVITPYDTELEGSRRKPKATRPLLLDPTPTPPPEWDGVHVPTAPDEGDAPPEPAPVVPELHLPLPIELGELQPEIDGDILKTEERTEEEEEEEELFEDEPDSKEEELDLADDALLQQETLVMSEILGEADKVEPSDGNLFTAEEDISEESTTGTHARSEPAPSEVAETQPDTQAEKAVSHAESSPEVVQITEEVFQTSVALSESLRLPPPAPDVPNIVSPLDQSLGDWVPVSPPLGPNKVLPEVIFTSASSQGASLLSQLCILVTLKRYNMTKNNTRMLFFHLVVPLWFVVTGLLALQFSTDRKVNPALTLAPEYIAPYDVDDGGHQFITIPIQGEFFVSSEPFQGYNTWTSFNKIPDEASLIDVVSATSTEYGVTGASVQRNSSTGDIIVWYNASSAHVLPAMWNLYLNLMLSRLDYANWTETPETPSITKDLRSLFNNGVPRVSTSIHAMPEKQIIDNAMPVLTFGVLVSVGMSFISSGFAAPIVTESISGVRLLQQITGLPTWVYWAGHYLWDSVVSLGITIVVMGIFITLDPMFRYFAEATALGVVTFLYLQASLILTYLAAHYYTTPWRAQAGIATVFLLAMCIPLIFSVSVTSSGGTFIKNFSNLAVYVFSPLYSLINAYLILANYVETDDHSNNPFYLVRYPIYGFVIAASCGLVLLALFEKRVSFLKFVKKRFPRPAGFYQDETNEDILPDLREELEKETKSVEKMRSCGYVPKDGILMHQLRKCYMHTKERVTALKCLDLRIPPGEVFALLGPSGAGKTTTVNLLVGAITPSQGDAFVDGRSILTDDVITRQSNMGVCMQKNALIPELTVSEHITFFATLRGIPAELVCPLSIALLTAFDLHKYRYSHVADLPISVTRRLSLLLAFIGRPHILVLDEPTSGMDLIGKKRAQQFMLNWMKEVRSDGQSTALGGGASASTAVQNHASKRPTVVMTSHSIDEVHLLSTRLGILVKGKLRCLGRLQELTARFGKGWALDVRTPNEVKAQAVTRFIEEIVPGYKVTSSRHGAVSFQLPRGTRSHRILQKIEQNKQQLFIEDYCLNQQSLEEVFAKTVMSDERSKKFTSVPPLSIVMLVVGTRGDVQPFLALALGLAKKGHTVRLSTHTKFKGFIESEVKQRLTVEPGVGRVEYYPIAGEPDELMSFMIDNPDLVTLETERIKANKEMMFDIFNTCWQACTTPHDFRPDVIIANPPVQCHVHIAERLQTHLQVHFTMPWTSTAMYPHPFAATDAFGNQESYYLVEKMIWLGLGAKVNEFRVGTLKVREMNHAQGLASRVKTPHLYCFSEFLLQRPTDWGSHISMAGYWFLERNKAYEPPKKLEEFLAKGEPPLYIGFGSIVLSDSDACTKAIVKTVEQMMEHTQARVLVQTCEASFTIPEKKGTEDKLMVWKDTVDHSWLFPKCCVVVHHGGAGTVAAVLTSGRPMVIIPFFGDQLFWGKVIEQNRLGRCVRKGDLSPRTLMDAICEANLQDVRENAVELGRKILEENGVEKGIEKCCGYLPLKEIDGQTVWEDECYENQRYYPLLGWTDTLLPGDPPCWSDKSGRLVQERYRFIPSKNWVWIDDWQVDIFAWPSEGQGFQYASSWSGVFHPRQRSYDFVRRRRWVRRRTHVSDMAAAHPSPPKDEVHDLREKINILQAELAHKDHLIDILQDEAASSVSMQCSRPLRDSM